jgi:hypothetical protein
LQSWTVPPSLPYLRRELVQERLPKELDALPMTEVVGRTKMTNTPWAGAHGTPECMHSDRVRRPRTKIANIVFSAIK